jgi:hypothetical protein
MIRLKLSMIKSVHFYKVNFANKQSSYEVSLTAVPGVDSKLKIYDKNKKLILNIDEQSIGESEKLWNLIPNDSVYLEVESKNRI